MLKVSQKQRKKLDKEKEDLTDQFGDSLESVYAKIAKRYDPDPNPNPNPNPNPDPDPNRHY